MNINNKEAVHACLLLRIYDIEPKPLDRIVDSYYRKHRELNSQSRRTIADIVFNVIRWRLRIENELRKQGVKKPTREQVVEYYLDHDPFEVADFPPRGSPSVVAAYYSLPEWFVKRLIKQEGELRAYSLMSAFKREAPVTLRINTLRASRDEVITALKDAGHDPQATRYSPYGISLPRRLVLAADENFKKGFFEVQDEASQLVTIAVGANAGETILDACAGAGGKSLMLAMLMRDSGTIIAADIDDKKLKELERRAKRANVTSITTVSTKKLEAMEKYRGKCDAVLLDVPCSGTGTLRRAPDLIYRLDEKDVAAYSKRQRALLGEYSSWLKPGGKLIYSTCSVLEEENESVVEDFLKSGGFRSLEREWMLNAGIDGRLVTSEGHFKVHPSESSMDGFFACVMGSG